MVAGVVLLVVAGLAVVGWVWRHPTAFREAGGWGLSHRSWPVDTPLYIGMTYETPDAEGRVTIHAARAKEVRDSANSVIDFFVCTVDATSGVGAIGAVPESDIHDECSSLVPAEGASMELNAKPRQQVVMAVSLARPGRIQVRGVELTYSHGWRRGTQLVGGEIDLRTRRQ